MQLLNADRPLQGDLHRQDIGILPRRAANVEPEELFRFYQTTLAAADKVVELYRWRTDHAPHSGGVTTVAVREQGEIVGATNLVPFTVCCRGTETRAAWQQDTVVDPAARGKGIGRALVKAGASLSELELGKGTLPAMYKLKKSIGFADAPNANYLVRVLAPTSAGKSMARRLLFPVLYASAKLRRQNSVRTGLTARPVSEFDTSFDGLTEQITAGNELTPRKSSGYLNWRYRMCPIHQYRVLRVDDGERLRGAVVLRLNQVPRGDAWLVDMICDTRDREAMDELLNAAFYECRSHGAGSIRTFAT